MMKTLQQARMEGIWISHDHYVYIMHGKLWKSVRGFRNNMSRILDVGVCALAPTQSAPNREMYCLFLKGLMKSLS